MVSDILLCPVSTTDVPLEELGIESISSYMNNKNISTNIFYFTKNNEYSDVMKYKFKIIGFNVFYSNMQIIQEIIDVIKKDHPEIKVIVGGHYATHNSEFVLKNMTDVDYIIRDEGEYTFYELAMYLLYDSININNIKGISYNKGQSIIHNEKREPIKDLDLLVFADRTEFVSLKKQLPFTPLFIESARGCTGTCSFCSASKSRWRCKSIKRFIDEIEYLMENYRNDTFDLTDSSFDNPYFNISRINEFIAEIDARKINPKLFIYLKSEIYKHTNDKFWEKFVQAGLCSAFIGVESFSDHDLKYLSKSANATDNINCVKNLKNRGFRLTLGFISFHPYTSIESLNTNNEILYSENYSSRFLQLNYLQMYPGTEIYKRAIKDGLYINNIKDVSNFSYVDKRIEELSDFIKLNIFSNNNLYNNIKTIADYFTTFEKTLYVIKSRLKNNNSQGDQIIDSYITDFNKLSEEVSYLVYNFFKELIFMFENQESQRFSTKIIDTYFNTNILENYLNSIFKSKKQLMRNLSKCNIPLSEIIK